MALCAHRVTTVIQWLLDIWRDFDTNIIINSLDQCGITSQINLHSALRAVVEENKTFSNIVDDFYEADEIYGFTNDDLELELDDGEMGILMELAKNDEIPSAQNPPLPTTTPVSSTLTTALNATTTSNATAHSSISATTSHDATATTSSATPTLNPIKQKIEQPELLKQL